MSVGLLNRNQLQELENVLRALPAPYDGHFIDGRFMQGRFCIQSPAYNQQQQGSSAVGAEAAAGGVVLYQSSGGDGTTGAPTTTTFGVCGGPSWAIEQTALFLGWWSFTPSSCPSCGSSGYWFPSLDEEYRCGSCSAGAGCTKTNEIVEDIGNAEDDWQDQDDDQEDLAHDAGMPDLGFLPTLEHFLRILRDLDGLLVHGGESVLESNRLPHILRIAVNILHLTLLPDVGDADDPQADSVIKASSLFLACSVETLHCVPFPLFQHAAACDVLWVDVEQMSLDIGISPEVFSFFTQMDKPMLNFMSIVPPEFRPPGITWTLGGRIPGIREYVTVLKEAQRETFSPDHTVACVVVELLRRFEEEFVSHAEYPRVEEWRRQASRAIERLYGMSPGSMVHLLKSESANVFLYAAAHVFHIHPFSMADILRRIGFYRGDNFLYKELHSALRRGEYSLPLTRRCSAFFSPWLVVYRALHSDDRSLLLQLLYLLSGSPQEVNKELAPATRLVQAILRKHGAAVNTLFYYCIRLEGTATASSSATESTSTTVGETAEVLKLMKGVYFCASVESDPVEGERANYCAFNGKKAISFLSRPTNPNSTKGNSVVADVKRQVVLDAVGLPQAKVLNHAPSLKLLPPFTARLESSAAKMLIDCCCTGMHSEKFSDAVARIESRMEIRRQILAGSEHELGTTLKECRPYITAHANRHTEAVNANSLTFLQPINIDTIAASFSQFLAGVHPTFMHCLSDSEAARRYIELRALKEADHPSLALGLTKKAAGEKDVTNNLPQDRQRRNLLDRGQGVRRMLRDGVTQLQNKALSVCCSSTTTAPTFSFPAEPQQMPPAMAGEKQVVGAGITGSGGGGSEGQHPVPVPALRKRGRGDDN